ncbi:MAG: hypothetical protein JNL82_38335 [Myxococcales bacterium]|jgi:hypothetical protein|nr:hypothetical protein [Myxococcales bacterium]
MSYFRNEFASFEEFKREALQDLDDLGKEEIELIREVEVRDNFHRPPRRGRRRYED